jgi:hypothetical protein
MQEVGGMKKLLIGCCYMVFVWVLLLANLSHAVDYRTIQGSVKLGTIDASALVLANGQSMFSSGSSLGHYELVVPLDVNGRITLMCFASGCAPIKEILTPTGSVTVRNIQLQRSSSTRMPLVDLVDIYIPSDPDRRQITGTVSYNGQPVISLVLVNGQSMFTSDGTFELDLPLDPDGDIVFYCFIAGFSPFKLVFDPDTLVTPIILDPTWLSVSQRLLGDWLFGYTIISYWENEYLLDTIMETTTGSSDLLNVWGVNEIGDPVIAGYSTTLDVYSLLDISPIYFYQFFLFDFLSDNSDDLVAGCYFHVDPDTGDLGLCYSMEGVKLADLKSLSSFELKEMSSASQIESEEERINEASQTNDLSPSVDSFSKFNDIAPFIYQEMLDQISEIQ